jgi:hypothetical protein
MAVVINLRMESPKPVWISGEPRAACALMDGQCADVIWVASCAGIDCGYIYPDGDFKKAPGSYRCPVCNSPKSRQVQQQSTAGSKRLCYIAVLLRAATVLCQQC